MTTLKVEYPKDLLKLVGKSSARQSGRRSIRR